MDIIGTIFGIGVLSSLGFLVLHLYRLGGSRSREAGVEVELQQNGSELRNVLSKFKGVKVSIETYEINKTDIIEIKLKYRIEGAGEFSICHENSMSRLKKKFGDEDLLTGDAVFDDNMLVQAMEPDKLTAFLNSVTRSSILKLDSNAVDFWFTWRELVVSCAKRDSAGSGKIHRYADAISCLMEEFGKRISLPERFVNIARYDEVPEVRLSALKKTVSRYPSNEKSLALFRECLDDKNVDIRIEAARGLGDEGMAYLAGALGVETKLKPADRIRIIREIGMRGYLKGIPALIDNYCSVPREERLVIIEVLGDLGDDSCCEFLLEQLKVHDDGIHGHALESLAACGNAAVVKRLRIMAAATRGKMIRSEYDDVADRIVARLEKTGGGRLSMPETSPLDGALSRDGTAGDGALSGAKKERG